MQKISTMIDGSREVIKEAFQLTQKVQEKEKIENKEREEMVAPKTDVKPEEKAPDVPVERIERMKKAFRPTWLQDQINSAAGKNTNGKKE